MGEPGVTQFISALTRICYAGSGQEMLHGKVAFV